MAAAPCSAAHGRRPRPAAALLRAIAIVAVVSSCLSLREGSAFAAPARRAVLLAGALPALLGEQRANAIPRVTDRAVFINGQKVEMVPYMKQGMDYLEKFGVDERMSLFSPRMARKMKIYATAFSASEAPDKTVKTLFADIDAFQKAIDSKDKDASIAAFEKYRTDIPRGVGFFDLKKPSTFEAPE
eukprot:CAMPEP_0171233312 /NCGR_PEP_ID=MMETSP0790-20130122/40855_1 /TAXON_ID=2925 /ORGANISM="Alexandrium catenella, Strain OF101" /LENGTH=185 /DNA_ID=CAMNT_0011699567 /DNA_START=68 /DNA_END=625 /DNA_ORIENTATION=-